MARTRTKLLAVRITERMLKELDARGDTLQQKFAWATIRRTDVVRVLLLSSLERGPIGQIPNDPVRADHLLSVRIPMDLIERLEKVTSACGPTVSRSDVVRALLAKALSEPTGTERN